MEIFWKKLEVQTSFMSERIIFCFKMVDFLIQLARTIKCYVPPAVGILSVLIFLCTIMIFVT